MNHVATAVRLHREPTGSWLTFPLPQPLPIRVKVTGKGKCRVDPKHQDQEALGTIEEMVETQFPGWGIHGLNIAQDGSESPPVIMDEQDDGE